VSSFRPLSTIEGYLPIEDHGLIGDGSTAALIGRDGAVAWLCVPRFDSPPLFARILDTARGGAFVVTPEDVSEARQFYETDSGVLVTELRSSTGTVRIRDALTLRSGADLNEDLAAARGELLRHVQVVQGHMQLKVLIDPYGGATAETLGAGLRIRAERLPDQELHLESTLPLSGLENQIDLETGEECYFALRWTGWAGADEPVAPAERLRETSDAWQRWMQKLQYEGPSAAQVRRSTITLKMLDYFENGSIVAAPTSSLPEAIGGSRNWDYRYAWIRDAAFSVYAFNRIGLTHEAAGFLRWVLQSIERHGRPRVLYDIDGELPAPERVAADLEGYRRSSPVRWGNAAADQRQHDVYGEILDCAYMWSRHHGALGDELWGKLREFVEAARGAWDQPDQGIWEVRAEGRVFTYSAALCQVALDRGARLARRFDLPGDAAAWSTEAEHIRQRILDDAWDDEAHSFTEHLGGGGGLDASLLALPLRRVVDANDPRMVATVEAIQRRLGAGDGLLYRYLPDESPDGLPGEEGAFLICSFWLVDNLTMQGRIEEATSLFESLCARATPLGLLPEQIDPPSGMFLGNYPQAFSHIGLISSAANLARASGGPQP